jgi:site-specific DNA recombinase
MKQKRYLLYARKSSESEDRQVLSIEAQLSEMQAIARREGLQIVEILAEARSAKTAGNRPVFSRMVGKLERREVDGILCWRLNRLARNMREGGVIIDLLSSGAISGIITSEKTYKSGDSVLLMSVEMGMSTQFSIDLARDSKRGLLAKAERGWYPAYPALGYMSDTTKRKGERIVIPDPDRFSLIRKAWAMLLSGEYNVAEIHRIAVNEWGLRSRHGKKPSKSNIHFLFANPFYYGTFEYPRNSGTFYKGAHEPMITFAEFEGAQEILRKRGRSDFVRQRDDFIFHGLIRCGECGAMITAEHRLKKQKNGNVHDYVYYRCTKKLGACTQPHIRDGALEDQIRAQLQKIRLPPQLTAWAFSLIKRENETLEAMRLQTVKAHSENYERANRKLMNLVDMRTSGLVDEEVFIHKRREYMIERQAAHERLQDAGKGIGDWVENAHRLFNFAEKAATAFDIAKEQNDMTTMRSILAILGSNLLLRDKKLIIAKGKLLSALEEVSSAAQTAKNRLEPQNAATHIDLLENPAIKKSLLRLLYFARTERFGYELLLVHQ